MDKLARFTPSLIFSFLQWPSPEGSPSLASLGNVLEKRSVADCSSWEGEDINSYAWLITLEKHDESHRALSFGLIRKFPYIRWNSEACFIGCSRSIMRSMKFLALWDSLVNLWRFQLESSFCAYFFLLYVYIIWSILIIDHWFLPWWPPLNFETLSLRLSMVSHTSQAARTCIH